jgi:peptidylprolyl isomerase
MKLFPVVRYRRWVVAGMALLALSICTRTSLFVTSLPAQTNAPASAEVDTDTGKPVVTTPSGLKYVDVKVGTGPAAKTGDQLSVNYEGKLLDGTKFDSSYDRGEPFPLVLGVSQVIQGWTEGLAGMKAGGIRKLIIPPQLGYGLQGNGDVIPPNATLIFKVEIVAIKPS